MLVTIIKRAIQMGIVFLYGSTGEIVTEKSGHLNLGIPGVMCVGAIGGCIGAGIAYNNNSPAFWVVISALFFAMLFGGLIGLLYSVFTISMRCNQNVTGLVITVFGSGVLEYWITKMGGTNFVDVSRAVFTAPMFGAVGEDWFSQIFLGQGVLVYIGIMMAIVVAIILKKTRVGLSLSAVGESPATADAAGINVTRYKYAACILGAAIAGIGGAYYYLNCTDGILEPGVIDATGWIAVALVIFCLWRPGIGIFGSFIFGLLYVLPSYVPNLVDKIDPANKELLKIIPYAVTAIVLIIISFFNKKETQPPSSLGLSYFREER